MNTKLLSELKIGEKGVVKRVAGKDMIRRKLFDMGIIKGVEVQVQRVAPMGDPVEISVKGYNLSLRRSETLNILVEIM